MPTEEDNDPDDLLSYIWPSEPLGVKSAREKKMNEMRVVIEEFPVEIKVHFPPGLEHLGRCPQRYVNRIARAQDDLRKAYQDVAAWEERAGRSAAIAWVRFHDEHGWPDIPGYEERLHLKAQIEE